jgi:hypothetical protein
VATPACRCTRLRRSHQREHSPPRPASGPNTVTVAAFELLVFDEFGLRWDKPPDVVASQASTRQEAAAKCRQPQKQRRQCLGLAAPGAELRFTLRNFCPCRHQQALARSLHQHFKL